MLYITSSDINESCDLSELVKQPYQNIPIDLLYVEESVSVSSNLELDCIGKLADLFLSRSVDSQDSFPYISNIYQNSVFPNLQLLELLSQRRGGHNHISLPYKYILKPRNSFYALAKGESQATFLIDSYQYYYRSIHQWAVANSLKIKYRNLPRLGLLDNVLKPILRAAALNVKVLIHLLTYLVHALRFKRLFPAKISLCNNHGLQLPKLSPFRLFIVRTSNHRRFFSNSFSSRGNQCLYLETSLTDSFRVYEKQLRDNSIFSLSYASTRSILRLLLLQVSLLFRNRHYYKAFSFDHSTLDISLHNGITLSLEDALYEVQQIYAELILFKKNLYSLLDFCKTNNFLVSDISSYEGRSPHSFVISSLSKYFGCRYIQHQSCLFHSSPLSVFPTSDCLFINKEENPLKFKSFFPHGYAPEIKHHDFNLIGTQYRFSPDSSPIIFFHPVSSEVNNRLLSCDIENIARIKYHPRLESFQANKDLFDSYKARILPKSQDAIELSCAITYCSAVIVELINCRIPFICLSPSRDYEAMSFFKESYHGFCASFDEALLLINDIRKLLDSFSSSYLSN